GLRTKAHDHSESLRLPERRRGQRDPGCEVEPATRAEPVPDADARAAQEPGPDEAAGPDAVPEPACAVQHRDRHPEHAGLGGDARAVAALEAGAGWNEPCPPAHPTH